MSGKPPKSTTTTTQQIFSPEETAARNLAFKEAETAFNAQQAKYQAAGNPSAVPVGASADTLQAQNLLKNYATGAGANLANSMNTAVNYGLTGAMDVNNNPHLQGAIDAASRGITRNYTDPNGVLANIRSSSINNGQYGGTRQGLAEGIAAGRYATELGDVASRMSSDAYNKGQDTFARTLGLAPSAMQAGMMPAQWLSAVGAQNEGYAQALNNYEAAGREFDLNKDFLPLQNYTNMVLGLQAPGTTATNSVDQGGSGKAMSALGGGMSGAMMGAPFGPLGMAVGGGLGVLMGLF
jgi:hypothetical protein